MNHLTSYRIRKYKLEDKFCQQVTAEVITEVISWEAMEASLAAAGVRERRVQIIAYTLNAPNRPRYGECHHLLTTLLDPHTYPIHDLITLYHERWEIEPTIDELDTHQRLVRHPLQSGKPVGVIQELYALLLAHFVVRSLMYRAAAHARLDPDRLSFTAAIRLITDAVPDFQLIHPRHHPHLWQRLLTDLAACTLPPHSLRTNPRVVKRKMSKFKRKRTAQLLPCSLPP